MTKKETTLIAAVQAGDPQAFDALYQSYAGRVFAFTRQLCGNTTEAEDLTQEAFVAAFQGLGRFRGQSTLLSWLLGIVVRRRRDAQRRRSHSPPIVPGYDPNHMGRTIDAILLDDALGALSEPLREAFLLVASQGLTHREAAHVLDEPLGTVKWRVAEATRRLRAALQDQEEKETPHVSPLHR